MYVQVALYLLLFPYTMVINPVNGTNKNNTVSLWNIAAVLQKDGGSATIEVVAIKLCCC